jgi:murein L,D-transpeptidase YcbB/YkuD
MQAMLADLLTMGDIEGAKPLAGYLANAVNAQGGRAAARPIEIRSMDAEGKPVTLLVNPETLQPMATFPASDARNPLEVLTAYQKAALDNQNRTWSSSSEDRMYDDFRQATNNVKVAAENWNTVAATGDAARRGDAAAQMALIFSFMKMLDPGSTVREGEYATAENARGVTESVRNQYRKVLDGQFLTPEQVDRFINQSKAQADAWKRKQGSAISEFKERAKRRGLNPDNVVYDWFGGIDSTSKPTNPLLR